MPTGTVIQGEVIHYTEKGYVIRTQGSEEIHLYPDKHTAHNGRPQIGEHVLSLLNDQGKVMVMTRILYFPVDHAA